MITFILLYTYKYFIHILCEFSNSECILRFILLLSESSQLTRNNGICSITSYKRLLQCNLLITVLFIYYIDIEFMKQRKLHGLICNKPKICF